VVKHFRSNVRAESQAMPVRTRRVSRKRWALHAALLLGKWKAVKLSRSKETTALVPPPTRRDALSCARQTVADARIAAGCAIGESASKSVGSAPKAKSAASQAKSPAGHDAARSDRGNDKVYGWDGGRDRSFAFNKNPCGLVGLELQSKIQGRREIRIEEGATLGFDLLYAHSQCPQVLNAEVGSAASAVVTKGVRLLRINGLDTAVLNEGQINEMLMERPLALRFGDA